MAPRASSLRGAILAALLAAALAAPRAHALAHTVSGLSSGAFFASQYHVAFSSEVAGAGIVAGGPYYCAQNSQDTATGPCMKGSPEPDISTLVAAAQNFEKQGTVDALSNLASPAQRVYVLAGTADTLVNPIEVQFYQALAPNINVSTKFDLDAEHCMPTLDYGNECTMLLPPYVGKCDYDTAGAILQQIYGDLRAPTSPLSENYMTLRQKQFVPSGAQPVGLAETAYIYVPSACRGGSAMQFNTSCRIHVALHGCMQNAMVAQGAFYENAGYNGWAEANGIIVLYPQTEIDVQNTQGCWDWWGYSGADYATKTGVQMATIHNMVLYIGSPSAAAAPVAPAAAAVATS